MGAEALGDLLARSSEEWLASARLPEPSEPLVLVGAGQLGRDTARRLARTGWRPAAFLDETPGLCGCEVEGVPVLGFDEAIARLGRTAWFAVTIWSGAHRYLRTRARLIDAGCERVCSFLDLAWSEPGELLPHYAFDLPGSTLAARDEIERAYALLADEESQRQFIAHLRFRLERDYSVLPEPSSPAYLDPAILGPLERVTYVDGGAYDGDTLRSFLAVYRGHLDAALAFEPDPLNHARLVEFVARLDDATRGRVSCHRAALGAEDGEVRLAAVGTEASAIDPAGTRTAMVRRLDSMLPEPLPGSLFLKLDVEGHEAAALRGAERVTQTPDSTFVACLYHRPADLWELPLLLHEMRPDMRLHVRTEGTDGAGVVCYAASRRSELSR